MSALANQIKERERILTCLSSPGPSEHHLKARDRNESVKTSKELFKILAAAGGILWHCVIFIKQVMQCYTNKQY